MTRSGITWTNLIFIAVAHLLAVLAIVYMAMVQFSWWTVGLAFLWAWLCGLSITGGYHRLFAHASYKTNALLKTVYLTFGAAAVQNSVLMWAADHRAHHAHTDTDRDPYNIQRGFWWAHIGWVLFRNDIKRSSVRDLERDPLIRLQDRYYVPLALLFGALIPGALGATWGDPIGAILVAGFLRLVVQWQATFAVNSLAHMIGRQPYSPRTSARDSFWVALLTLGEGYHNFHHRFQRDFRNGVRWYHFDPTKWTIWGLSKLGMASDLRRAPKSRIEAARRAASAEQSAPGPLRTNPA